MLAKAKASSFVRNVLVVMAGSVAAQAVGFALSPAISRLFTPADFGVFGSFGAVAGMIAAFATLDYSQAVMLPSDREDAGQVFLLSCIVTLAVTFACGAVCVLLPDLLLGILGTQSGWLLAVLVLAVLAGGLSASFQAWCVRNKAFRRTSSSQLVRGLSSNGLQVCFGFAHTGAPGLVISSVFAELLAGLSLAVVSRGDVRAILIRARWGHLKRLATEYRDFPLYSATQNLLNALSSGLPVLLLTHYFGIAVAGAYAFGIRLIEAPMSLVMSALRQVLFQRAGEMQHHGRPLSPLFLKSTAGLFGLGVGPALLLAFSAPALFAWVFGAQWRGAGEFARYLVVWLLFVFCNLPSVLFARLVRIQREVFLFNVVLLIARVSALMVGGTYLTALQTVGLFSVVGGVMNLALIVLVGRALLKREGYSLAMETMAQ